MIPNSKELDWERYIKQEQLEKKHSIVIEGNRAPVSAPVVVVVIQIKFRPESSDCHFLRIQSEAARLRSGNRRRDVPRVDSSRSA